jgi:hypothetical protein
MPAQARQCSLYVPTQRVCSTLCYRVVVVLVRKESLIPQRYYETANGRDIGSVTQLRCSVTDYRYYTGD